MFTKINSFFSPDQLLAIKQNLARLPWEDGQITAAAGKKRKQNEQITHVTKAAEPLRIQVQQLVLQHPAVQLWAEPRRIGRLMFSRYREGAFYGSHNDAAIIRLGPLPVRADISFTIFLNDPAEYGGGELVLESPVGELVNKEPSGTLLMYETGLRHRVEAITSGERLVVVGWIESLIRSPQAREVMRDIKATVQPLVDAYGNDSEEAITARRAIANFYRVVAET